LLFGAVVQDLAIPDVITVRATWNRFFSASGQGHVELNQLRWRPIILETETDNKGNYALCGVPVEHLLRVDLLTGGRIMSTDSVRVGSLRVERRDFRFSRR
jgi:hypothetical protein